MDDNSNLKLTDPKFEFNKCSLNNEELMAKAKLLK